MEIPPSETAGTKENVLCVAQQTADSASLKIERFLFLERRRELVCGSAGLDGLLAPRASARLPSSLNQHIMKPLRPRAILGGVILLIVSKHS